MSNHVDGKVKSTRWPYDVIYLQGETSLHHLPIHEIAPSHYIARMCYANYFALSNCQFSLCSPERNQNLIEEPSQC